MSPAENPSRTTKHTPARMRLLPIRTLALMALLALAAALPAQVMPTMYHANHLGYRLPGTLPKERFLINLPGFGAGLYNSGFTFGDLVSSTTGDIVTLDVPGVLGKLDERNDLRVDGSIQTLGVGFRIGKVWLEAGHQMRFENHLDYPRDAFRVFFQGNAPFIGQTADLGLRVDIMSYSELYAGAAAEFGPLSLGARLKWLNGLTSLHTERNRLDLYTSDDVYQLELTSDYLLHASPDPEALNGGEIGLETPTFDLDRIISRNSGLAFDLGASLRIGEKLRLDAAVMDFGSILWKDDVVAYTSNKTISYEGTTFGSLFSEDSLSLEASLDTLEDLLGFEEVAGESYRTALPWHFQAGARYQVLKWLDVSGVFFGQMRGERMFSGVSVGGNARFKVLETGLSYTAYGNSFFNIGLHGMLRLGPVRLYLATDNIVNAFRPNDSRLANGRAGLQLAF